MFEEPGHRKLETIDLSHYNTNQNDLHALFSKHFTRRTGRALEEGGATAAELAVAAPIVQPVPDTTSNSSTSSSSSSSVLPTPSTRPNDVAAPQPLITGTKMQEGRPATENSIAEASVRGTQKQPHFTNNDLLTTHDGGAAAATPPLTTPTPTETTTPDFHPTVHHHFDQTTDYFTHPNTYFLLFFASIALGMVLLQLRRRGAAIAKLHKAPEVSV